MSGVQSSLSGRTDCESNMGDVLGKEGREDELSERFEENMVREEAEGAEAEEGIPPRDIRVSPEPDLDPGEKAQDYVASNLILSTEAFHEEAGKDTNDAMEHQEPTPVIVANEDLLRDSQETSSECEETDCLKGEEVLIPPLDILCNNSLLNQKIKDKRTNSEDFGVFDVEESDIDIQNVGDADDEDGYEDDDDDDYEDYDDDDEEGGVDADDEDDFAENEVTRSPIIGESFGADDLQTKRSGDIKVNSDCVYSYSDSSDDSGLRSKNKNGARICDSMRRRKLNKVKECALTRSNIPSQIDQTSMLSDAMTSLSLDSGMLHVQVANENKIMEGEAADNVFHTPLSEGIVTTTSEPGPDVYQGEVPVTRPLRSEGILSTEEENSSLNEEDIKELMQQEAMQRRRESCSCESCETKRITLVEQRKLQGAWMELRHFVREVYRIIMQTAPDDVMPIVDSSQDEHMKAIAKRLTQSDPHQLYHRLQAQVYEVATAVKVRLKDISEDHYQDSLVATDYFEGLFYCYDKVSAAAKRVAPVLEDLEAKHLSRFNLTWELLNKAIYYQVVYNDAVISQKLPEMISLVSDKGQEFQGMIQFYMAFDDEMSIIQAMWRESFELLQKYNTQQAKIRAKQQMLLRDWELFKAQRKRLQHSYDEGIEIDRHSSAAGNGSEVDEGTEVVVCPSCNRVQPCPCDECCLSHLFACRTHQAARRADYSPTIDGPRIAGDGAGDSPNVEHILDTADQKCECNVCIAFSTGTDRNSLCVLRSPYGPSYFVPSELHPPPLNKVEHGKPCPYGCFCNGEDGTVEESSQSQTYPLSSQQAGCGDGNGVYPHLYNVDPSLLDSLGTKQGGIADAQPQSATPNHCQNNICQNVEKTKSSICRKQGEKKCTKQITSSTITANDHAHINGLTRNEFSSATAILSSSIVPSCLDNEVSHQKPLPQPRARFTAGPGVNVPDTDIFPDPPADFAASPSEFAAEIKVGAVSKQGEVGRSDMPQQTSKGSLTPLLPSTNIGSLAANGQEPIFVLTKAGAAPPTNIPMIQGKTASSVPSTPPTTPPSNKTAPSGPSIQGLLEEALERKKAEMAKAAAAATTRESRPVVSASSAPITESAVGPTASQPKPKLGHTCSSAKHKQHTHSPSHRDPKNCDCCFCEMFGHGAPPAAPTSHRFHENRQRLRSKLNKNRATKQQASVKTAKVPTAPAVAVPQRTQAAAAAAPQRTQATTTAAMQRTQAATTAEMQRTQACTAAAPQRTQIATASTMQRTQVPTAAAMQRTQIPTAATPQRTQVATAAAPQRAQVATAAAMQRTQVATAAAPQRTQVATAAATQRTQVATAAATQRTQVATAAAMQRTQAAAAMQRTQVAATPRPATVGAASLAVKTAGPQPATVPPAGAVAAAARGTTHSVTAAVTSNLMGNPQMATTVRPAQVSAAKLAKTQPAQLAQPTSNIKATVTTSNQRLAAPSACAVNGTQPPSHVPQTAQPVQAATPQKKITTPLPAPALLKEEETKKDDPRPIDELLDFIEGPNSQPKTSDSKKAAKKARQKQKKLEQQREEEMVQTPDVTITMLKESESRGKGKKGSNKRTEEVISTIPSATAQSIRDRIKSQVGEVAKKMGTSDQPQMVTIRRVMEPNSNEPTVTITLKGATPDKDKVLFTLVNGQNEVVCHDQASDAPKSKKQRKLERRLLRQQQLQQIQVEEGIDDDDDDDEFQDEEEQEEEIDMSKLTKTQRKKLRRLQRKQEEERLAEEQRQQEEFERLQLEEEKRRREEEERLLQLKSKKSAKKEKLQKSQLQQQNQISNKKNQKSSTKSQAALEQAKVAGKTSKINSAPDSDEEFIVPVQMTKKERKKARKVQQLLEEEQRRQRQKEEEEREKQRQQELKEQKKKQKELEKLKKQQPKQEKQKYKEPEKKQKQTQSKSQTQQQQQLQLQQQQQQKQKQKQSQAKQQQVAAAKRGGRITTSIIPNPLTLGSYMPPVGSLEWTSQALAATRHNVTIQPASMSSASSSLGGLEQRFSTTLTLNGKPIIAPPRQPSPEPTQDFSLENFKLPPGITITKVDPSQVSQRKPPISKPQVTKTVVPNPTPTTIIAAPLSGNRQSNFNSGSGQDPNSNVIVVDTGKLKQDIAKKEDEPEQVVSRKKKNGKNKKSSESTLRTQQPPPQLSPFLYGMNSVSITPAGQPPPYAAAPAAPPQAAIIKMNGNMVTIRNPAIHPTPQRYIGPDESASRKSTTNNSPVVHQNRSKDSNNLPPRFANAKLAQQTNGMNGYVPEFSTSNHRTQHYTTPQTYEASKQQRLHYEPPPRHFEPRPYEPNQSSHYDGHAHHFDATTRQHFEHSTRHIDTSSRSFEHASRHFETSAHHFDHSGHLYNSPPQQVGGVHEKPTKHVVPQNYAAAMEGKKSKLKNAYNDDWQLLDNVFAPKDIDLDDGDIDDDERELEAFKRFCLQSVPPKRKEKVHLNIEDIVLKKKSSAVSCT